MDLEDICQCQKEFIEGMSNGALEQGVCGVCACRLFVHDMDLIALNLIPHQQLLKPTMPHAAQILMKGMLLKESAI